MMQKRLLCARVAREPGAMPSQNQSERRRCARGRCFAALKQQPTRAGVGIGHAKQRTYPPRGWGCDLIEPKNWPGYVFRRSAKTAEGVKLPQPEGGNAGAGAPDGIAQRGQAPPMIDAPRRGRGPGGGPPLPRPGDPQRRQRRNPPGRKPAAGGVLIQAHGPRMCKHAHKNGHAFPASGISWSAQSVTVRPRPRPAPRPALADRSGAAAPWPLRAL